MERAQRRECDTTGRVGRGRDRRRRLPRRAGTRFVSRLRPPLRLVGSPTRPRVAGAPACAPSPAGTAP